MRARRFDSESVRFNKAKAITHARLMKRTASATIKRTRSSKALMIIEPARGPMAKLMPNMATVTPMPKARREGGVKSVT